MSLKNQTQGTPPFHAGEIAIQQRMGVEKKAAAMGQRFIRDFMPAQHREFYAQLPFILVGSLDEQQRPWASILTGAKDFITAPNDVTLNFRAKPLSGDRLNENLKLDANFGFLGIELATRRRNRVNGKVSAVTDAGFAVHVAQSFGNCPQFIQKRRLQWLPERLKHPVNRAQSFDHFTADMHRLISKADSFFMASSFNNHKNLNNQGVDISHRGGKPDFVKLEGDRQFIFPNFAGNNFYNTLGNLHLNNRVGILFVDFETGDLLSLTGTAEIIWESDELTSFTGAEQLIRITAEEIVSMPEVLPFSWDFEEYSPAHAFVGDW
ncbi:MAG: pyridoxamine 5'-phosphate oxidase family protein [Limnothrix sp.]